MSVSTWILVVWLTYGDVDRIWLEETFSTEADCRKWQTFYSEYPFRPSCIEVKQFRS